MAEDIKNKGSAELLQELCNALATYVSCLEQLENKPEFRRVSDLLQKARASISYAEAITKEFDRRDGIDLELTTPPK